MAALKEMVKEEKERLLRMMDFYLEKIKELPKGSIIFKNRKDRKYPYLIYRDGQLVKTDYLKININELKELSIKINKRRKYLKILREIKKDLKDFQKI
jgi:hypothetical protein